MKLKLLGKDNLDYYETKFDTEINKNIIGVADHLLYFIQYEKNKKSQMAILFHTNYVYADIFNMATFNSICSFWSFECAG